jgi:hypothetical protein
VLAAFITKAMYHLPDDKGSATTQKTAIFVCAAVKTSNLTETKFHTHINQQENCVFVL